MLIRICGDHSSAGKDLLGFEIGSLLKTAHKNGRVGKIEKKTGGSYGFELLISGTLADDLGTFIAELFNNYSAFSVEFLEEKQEPPEAQSVRDLQSVLSRPFSDLNLHVRPRKALRRLNITTIGELVARTADELLAAGNFGMHSLNEVRENLRMKFNLKLKGD